MRCVRPLFLVKGLRDSFWGSKRGRLQVGMSVGGEFAGKIAGTPTNPAANSAFILKFTGESLGAPANLAANTGCENTCRGS